MARRNGKLTDDDKLVTRGQLRRVLQNVMLNHDRRYHVSWRSRLAGWFLSTRMGQAIERGARRHLARTRGKLPGASLEDAQKAQVR